ncbi:OstA-like protein [Dokdonia sinensis]|uniref:OstA-like protein n=1 Tax=Dokdonia sinensis TaxID=2479847 RepID=A0A3M0GI89_9FLAO|nr:OstA-like protein [Dokdonia sinensis]RMB63998.1 OstA-like protein [Dokdonia sinensis]
MRLILIVLIAFFAFAKADAQETPKEINIESPINRINEEEYPGAVVFQKADKQVYIEHDGVDMWCDLAFFYKDDNFVKALGNVRMQQGDSVSMRSQYAEYSGDTKFAFASGKVWLKKDTTTVTTDTMYFDRIKQQSYYRSGGTVTSPNSKITSRIGRYYMEQDKISFVNDVVVTNPEYVINSEQLDFYSVPEHAYLYGPTTITSDGSKVYCERGFYDTRNDLGYFVKNSRIDYDNRVVLGDSLYYDRTRNFASATNNIRVRDSINNTLIKGHYAEVYKDKDSVFITQRAVAITVEKQDSVYIHGDKLIVTGKPEERIVRGFKNVRLYKSDLSGKSDSIHVNQKTGLTQMITRPILWSDRSQITGDSIHLINNVVTEKLDSLKVFDNSFIIQQDSISGFNQVKGQKLFGFFNEENELEKVDILKNAESITYLREDDGSLQGIDKSKSASITILFLNKEIDEVIKYKGISGEVYPESQFPENARTLENFNWRGDEKLLSKEDIFKGEPPFELTKIQGIPLPEIQDNFFELPEGTEERTIPGASNLDAETFETREEDKPSLNSEEEETDGSREQREAIIERNKAAAKAREEARAKDGKKKPKGLGVKKKNGL